MLPMLLFNIYPEEVALLDGQACSCNIVVQLARVRVSEEVESDAGWVLLASRAALDLVWNAHSTGCEHGRDTDHLGRLVDRTQRRSVLGIQDRCVQRGFVREYAQNL